MFERYTEKARRMIFFSRYEASQFGSPYIETEHLLMGLLREAKDLVVRFQIDPEKIRQEIEKATVVRSNVSTSVDLPLSNECKRVLAFAAEEAERLNHKHIGTEHFLVALMREEHSVAAELLRKAGLTVDGVREKLGHAGGSREVPSQGRHFPVEFIEGEQTIALCDQKSTLPVAGDEIVFSFSNGPKTFEVTKVRFLLVPTPSERDDGTQSVDKVQVFLRQVAPAE